MILQRSSYMYQLKLDKLTDGQTCYWFWETQRSGGPKLADIISSNYKKVLFLNRISLILVTWVTINAKKTFHLFEISCCSILFWDRRTNFSLIYSSVISKAQVMHKKLCLFSFIFWNINMSPGFKLFKTIYLSPNNRYIISSVVDQPEL